LNDDKKKDHLEYENLDLNVEDKNIDDFLKLADIKIDTSLLSDFQSK